MDATEDKGNRHNPVVARLLVWSTRGVPQFLRRAICILAGSDIRCPLPASTIMPHPYGIFVHASARLGENVTIGIRAVGENRAPYISNNVYIGAGAILLGPIRVAEEVVIGAGAVVVKDVPSRCTVVGNPARVLQAQRKAVE